MAFIPRILVNFTILLSVLTMTACGGGGGGGGEETVVNDPAPIVVPEPVEPVPVVPVPVPPVEPVPEPVEPVPPVEPEPEPATYNLSGIITVGDNISVDNDTNDQSAPDTRDDITNPQILTNPIMLNGFVSKEGTGVVGDRFEVDNDESDWFKTTLYAGQYVSLRNVNFDAITPTLNDIDLYLFDSNLGIVGYSSSLTEFESIAITTDGEYFIQVISDAGSSTYIMNIDSTSMATGRSIYGQPASFVPNQAIVKQRPLAGRGIDIPTLDQASGFNLSHNNTNRSALLSVVPETTIDVAAKTIPSWEDKLPKETREKIQTIRMIKELNLRPDVEYAEPNFLMELSATPNDMFYSYQVHYPQINLPQAWDVLQSGTPDISNVIVAVIDSGVMMEHPDLDDQLVPGYDFISSPTIANDGDGIDNDPSDPGNSLVAGESTWHGTHVSGTISAETNNTTGVAGVSWGAKIMPIRVLGVGGGTFYDMGQGVRYAAGLDNDSGTVPSKPADILNLSMGGYGFSQDIQNNIMEIYNSGVIIIAAAGNDNIAVPYYPASYDGVVSVSATDFQNEKAYYSNHGPSVDVAAPGGDRGVDLNGDGYQDGVLSCSASDIDGTIQPQYSFMQGTSMAAPHVAGVAAIMKAIHPDLTPNEFDTLLASGQLTDDLGDPGRDDNYGYGIINAFKAAETSQELFNGTLPGTVFSDPASVYFAALQNEVTITLNSSGNNPPTVVNFSDDAEWLTVNYITADANGLGEYTLTADRANLSPNDYNATLTFMLSDNATLEVNVALPVISMEAQPGDAGYVNIVVFDSDMNYYTHEGVVIDGGIYDYQFRDLPEGQYYIGAGSDIDNSNHSDTCEIGETCGAYPSADQPDVIWLNQNVTDIDFQITIAN